MKKIAIDEKRCTGCRVCESFCSFSHENFISPALSRISIINVGTYEEKPKAIVCRQCERPKCAEACPEGALRYDYGMKFVIFTESDCTKCGICADACPYGAITIHFEKKIPLKCDLCDGDPICIKYCKAEAIKLEEVPDEIEIKRKKFNVE